MHNFVHIGLATLLIITICVLCYFAARLVGSFNFFVNKLAQRTDPVHHDEAETVNLRVTQAVLVSSEFAINQRQIAVSEPTGGLGEVIAHVNGNNRKWLRLGDSLILVIGDTGAIWRSHNQEYQQDFDRLFEFLAKNPDQKVKFICSIAE